MFPDGRNSACRLCTRNEFFSANKGVVRAMKREAGGQGLSVLLVTASLYIVCMGKMRFP